MSPRWNEDKCLILTPVSRLNDIPSLSVLFPHSKFIRMCVYNSVKKRFLAYFALFFTQMLKHRSRFHIRFDLIIRSFIILSSPRSALLFVHNPWVFINMGKSCDYLSINTSIDWTCIIGCENGSSDVADKIDRFYIKLKLQKPPTAHVLKKFLSQFYTYTNILFNYIGKK